MPSPFPGMDPFLEDQTHWPGFHHQLVTSLYQVILPGLVDRYRARIGIRQYSVEQPLFTSILREDHQEEFIEIRRRSDGRLVSHVEVISPTNKLNPQGRAAYLGKRNEVKQLGANLIEIDLVLQGQPIQDYAREGLPDWDYAVMVARANRADRVEIYTTVLQKRLPHFRLPLERDDRDTVVDLQTTFARSYEQGGFLGKLNYQQPPATTLDQEDLKWLDELLKNSKLR